MDLDSKTVRRKLITGGLSAPLVMTVTSATGAPKSSFAACLANGANLPRPDILGPDDQWLRWLMDTFEVELRQLDGKYVKQAGRYFVGPNGKTLYQLSELSPNTLPPTKIIAFDARTPGLRRINIEKRAALAYVAEDGEVVGYGWEPNGGFQCKKSCYSSVVARAG